VIAGLGNAHLVAVAALFSPYDPYRELFYPGGCGTDGQYARWMYASQLKDGVTCALDRLAAITGQPAETITLPSPVRAVDGPDGPALLDAAIGERQSNTDAHALMCRVPFRDDRVASLDWEATAPAASGLAIASSGVPMLVRAGWLDRGFAAGALARFVTQASHQQVEIGPWGHGGGSFADTLRRPGAAEHDLMSLEARAAASLSSSPGTWSETASPGTGHPDIRHPGHRRMAGRHLLATRGCRNAAVVPRSDGRPDAGSRRTRFVHLPVLVSMRASVRDASNRPSTATASAVASEVRSALPRFACAWDSRRPSSWPGPCFPANRGQSANTICQAKVVLVWNGLDNNNERAFQSVRSVACASDTGKAAE
jgi:hypothetical protein